MSFPDDRNTVGEKLEKTYEEEHDESHVTLELIDDLQKEYDEFYVTSEQIDDLQKEHDESRDMLGQRIYIDNDGFRRELYNGYNDNNKEKTVYLMNDSFIPILIVNDILNSDSRKAILNRSNDNHKPIFPSKISNNFTGDKVHITSRYEQRFTIPKIYSEIFLPHRKEDKDDNGSNFTLEEVD